MSSLAFITKVSNGRAKCQVCREYMPKAVESIYIYHFFTGDGGYYHKACIDKLLDTLATPKVKEEPSCT